MSDRCPSPQLLGQLSDYDKAPYRDHSVLQPDSDIY